jgi:1-acyl-sn-glycerol-3-phosphate acyltransferase
MEVHREIPAREERPELIDQALIAPYLKELFGYERFVEGVKAFLPEKLFHHIMEMKDRVNTIEGFQTDIILHILNLIEQISIRELTSGGLEHLDPGKQYLFISNHRDIVLDSAFLNTTLFKRGFRTSQIAIGDNLMRHRISDLIFRMNKSFVVKRTGSPTELYKYSVLLSEHIRTQISEGIDSVWIAQREGRAKDGNDRTQTGLLKMLTLGQTGDLKSFFQSLHIVPVAISYEFDPCDLLKAQEFVNKKNNPDYKKSFEEDLQHILLGLRGQKGRVHFEFGKPLGEELDVFDELPNSKKQLEALAGIIDSSIHKNYALHGINEIANKLLKGDQSPCTRCDEGEEEVLNSYFNLKQEQLQNDTDGSGYRYLLSMYANPLINRESGVSV